ncbi:helix-turn-helix domain-containing protein [Levilactobacillus brevis]|uniref:helix-turn-helix domain-containing protein n=1 Tax=Levilactobacillus brevis TaxID=1580 RepID=UPI0030CEBC71
MCVPLNNFSKILGAKLLKIEDVSKATGISRTTLTNLYYKRQNNVELNTLKKICDFLQVPLSELLEYVPSD